MTSAHLNRIVFESNFISNSSLMVRMIREDYNYFHGNEIIQFFNFILL